MKAIKRAAAIVMTLALMLILSSCEYLWTEKEIDESNEPGVENNMDYDTDEKNLKTETGEKHGEIIGDYKYPENPAEQLRSALENDTNKRGLPMEIGDVETIEFEGKEYAQIKITFTGGNENMCVISFINKYLEYGYDASLDGRDNPSFTMAFKDPDSSQDMITVLTSVIKHLSPDLSLEEAERLATTQDDTISTDGYSQPSDINGYQIQARYTNPHVFVRTPDFEAKFGVNIKAIKQLWSGAIDPQQCYELVDAMDYNLLEVRYWDAEKHPAIVYADFIVKNMWQKQSYLHGETWVVVDVESMTGKRYSLALDTWEFPNPYEFGIGRQYTLYIGITNYRGGIIYAVQQSESEEFNSRGEQHPLDYPTEAWHERLRRVEPEGDGTIYNVYFALKSQTWGESFAALHGQGIGEAQWPGSSPAWDNYTFVGWYDNTEWNGEPYTKDTPIYQDTTLFARWKYIGSGGVWPRAYRGEIEGMDNRSAFPVGQKLTITANGYNMNLESPKDQRFRWYPVTWRLSDGTNGTFSKEAPFQTTLLPEDKGEQSLYITYLEEIFDGVDWQETGQLREVPESMFRVE